MDRRITLLTLAGHSIAGAARFLVEAPRSAVRFEVQTYDRPATVIDQIMLRTVGDMMQRDAWISFVENVARAADGRSADIESSTEELDEHEMHVVDEWAKPLSAQLSRNSTSRGRD